jgi:hypothetical protein
MAPIRFLAGRRLPVARKGFINYQFAHANLFGCPIFLRWDKLNLMRRR